VGYLPALPFQIWLSTMFGSASEGILEFMQGRVYQARCLCHALAVCLSANVNGPTRLKKKKNTLIDINM